MCSTPGTPKHQSAPGLPQSSIPPRPRPAPTTDNNPHVQVATGDVIPPAAPKKNKVKPESQTPNKPSTYDPAIRCTPDGAGRQAAAAAPVSAPAVLHDVVPAKLLWPNVDSTKLLGLNDMIAWEEERARHHLPTLPQDHAAARARHNHFVINDGRDDLRNVGGFDAASYEGDAGKRKIYCDQAYEDLRRARVYPVASSSNASAYPRILRMLLEILSLRHRRRWRP
ncbi:hypothetical protein AURDEDRAFT_174430 [Auricularia subglabra TFB-10046 SS5]|uniref:Uncharacterized protein n=1 Tax=Auricularia subglabra (strain TFB-10046 / SS5) TaxID=717982 RepID=J0WUM1_AURST|nr:hypothetical protein AURDEDRAFT_174430 [Auricularia subglabra TFB-10046 SS5]